MRITHQETIGNVVFQEFAPVSGSHALQCEQTREARFLKKLEPHVDDWEGSKVVPGDDVRQELATREISPRRHNLLKWFHFAPDATLLEIGCGWGELTGLFAARAAQVTAVDVSPRRARLTALRHKALRNLQVFAGELAAFVPAGRYDYVCIIGSLGYGARSFPGPEPAAAFLRWVAHLLQPDGVVILAVDNAIGLDRVLGLDRQPSGLDNGLPTDGDCLIGGSVFTRKELSDLLHSAGLQSLEWFYPLPDYTSAELVLSDAIEPDGPAHLWELLAHEGQGNRQDVEARKQLARGLARAGLFHEFANSFLVAAHRGGHSAESAKCLRFRAANPWRQRRFQLDSVLLQNERGERILCKRPGTPEAEAFLAVVAEREQLAAEYFGQAAKVVTGTRTASEIRYPFLALPTLEECIVQYLQDGQVNEADAAVERYCQFIRNLPTARTCPRAFLAALGLPAKSVRGELTCLRAGPIDLVPANILIASDCWHLVDHEWFFEFPVPVDLVIYRGIANLAGNAQDAIRVNARNTRLTLLSGGWAAGTCIPMAWLKMIATDAVTLKTLSYWNMSFQAGVLEYTRAKPRPFSAPASQLQDSASTPARLVRNLRWSVQHHLLRCRRFLMWLQSHFDADSRSPRQ